MLRCGFATRANTVPYAAVRPAYNRPEEVQWTEIVKAQWAEIGAMIPTLLVRDRLWFPNQGVKVFN